MDSSDASPPSNTAEAIAPRIPPDARKIDDLSQLPPGLAANPAFQKLYEDAKALNGSVWVKGLDKNGKNTWPAPSRLGKTGPAPWIVFLVMAAMVIIFGLVALSSIHLHPK